MQLLFFGFTTRSRIWKVLDHKKVWIQSSNIQWNRITVDDLWVSTHDLPRYKHYVASKTIIVVQFSFCMLSSFQPEYYYRYLHPWLLTTKDIHGVITEFERLRIFNFLIISIYISYLFYIFFLFFVCFHYFFILLKNVHPVSGAGIRTHYLLITSLLT